MARSAPCGEYQERGALSWVPARALPPRIRGSAPAATATEPTPSKEGNKRSGGTEIQRGCPWCTSVQEWGDQTLGGCPQSRSVHREPSIANAPRHAHFCTKQRSDPARLLR